MNEKFSLKISAQKQEQDGQMCCIKVNSKYKLSD